MATVDHLAKMLSERTGTHFEVLRGRPQPQIRPGRMVPNTLPLMRYGLRATRSEFSHTFQGGRPMKLWDLTRWLASLNDMVVMGFIPGADGWHRLRDEQPSRGEMFIWARPKDDGGWGLGLAYWNVSGGYSDAYGAPLADVTHWKRIGDPPRGKLGDTL